MLLKVEILGKQSADRAADYLVDVLRTDPDSKIANSALAQVRIQQKKYAEAAAILQRLWEQDRDNHEYQFGMAMLAMQMKDWAKAERLFEELQRVDYGDDGVVESYLAQIAEETGRFDVALERFRAVPEGERGWIAQLRVAAMLGKLGRVDEARRYLADLPAVTREQRVQVQQAEAQVLRDAGNNAAAYAVLASALDQFPDDPDLLYDIAMVAEKLDKIDVVETEAHAPHRAQARQCARAERAGVHARRSHAARGRGAGTDRARAGARRPTTRSFSTASAGRISGWVGSTTPRSTCGGRWSSDRIPRSPRTWARCCGRRAIAPRRRTSGRRN